MQLSVSKSIDRPADVVFDFFAVHHLRNHPRWDPAHSRVTIEPETDARATITMHLDIPAMEASMDPSMMQATLDRMKELIESET